MQDILDALARELHNPQIIDPAAYIPFEKIEIDGKIVIHGYVVESASMHRYLGRFYDRNQDGDFEAKSVHELAEIIKRKEHTQSERWVFPQFSIDDLDTETFDRLKKTILSNKPNHEWLTLGNEAILNSAGLILEDKDTGATGLSLAAILLFGKDETIRKALPHYRIDALLRVRDVDLYDDRLIIESNLIRAYEQLMAFVGKHLPEQPYIEGIFRFSLRDKILREVILNLLIHAEYSGARTSRLTIHRHTIETVNWNTPRKYGQVDLSKVIPFRKNPLIAKVFVEMGIVEELGSGTRKLIQYVPLYSGGKMPVLSDEEEYKVEIPYISTLQLPIDDLKNDLKNDLKVLEVIKHKSSASYEYICEVTGLSRYAVRDTIQQLKEEGRIVRRGGRKTGFWEVVEP